MKGSVLAATLAQQLTCANGAASQCYALALSGGNDHGAWEAGVVQGLVSRMSAAPEEAQWSVVTGVSMGAVIASNMALFDLGQEVEMSEHVVSSMLSLSNSPGPQNVYQPWSANVDPTSQTGFYNTTAEYDTLQRILGSRAIGNRKFTIGATDLTTGQLTLWDETSVLNAGGSSDVPKWASYVRASSATPGTFETVHIDGAVYSDGSISLGTDVFSAVTRCKDAGYAEQDIVVDVVTADGVALKSWDASADNTTVQLGLRGTSVGNYNSQMSDIRDACRAYPAVNWRYYVEATDLPSNGGDFNRTDMEKMVTAGQQAAASAQVGIHCDYVEGKRRSKTTPTGPAVASTTDKCYAMALSGGGDKGAWEAGVVKGLVKRLPAGEREWAVTTGISAGSIIAAGMALFDMGQEEAMGQFLVDSVLNFTNIPGPANVYKPWPHAYETLTKSGTFDTDPEYNTLFEMFTQSGQTLGNRAFTLGSTDDTTGTLTLFDETSVRNADGSLNTVKWATGVRASSAVPGAFESVDVDGVTNSDGGCVMGVNIFSAVTRCKEAGYKESDIVVDLITCSSPSLKSWNATADDTSTEIKARADALKHFDTEMVDLFDACEAYPDVNWRFFVAAGELPSNGLAFNLTQMEEMATIGQQNAAAVSEGFDCNLAQEYRSSKKMAELHNRRAHSAQFFV